tara:strand:+ start:22056 stop:22235 length:180 start_codon:yes stop_codon:yes gene_type:complete
MKTSKKQIGWYLIFGGLIVIAITFITKILAFLAQHPFIFLAVIAIGIGSYILFFDSKTN